MCSCTNTCLVAEAASSTGAKQGQSDTPPQHSCSGSERALIGLTNPMPRGIHDVEEFGDPSSYFRFQAVALGTFTHQGPVFSKTAHIFERMPLQREGRMRRTNASALVLTYPVSQDPPSGTCTLALTALKL